MSAFCTQADLEMLLQIDLTGHEAAAVAAIMEASAYIQTYTKQTLEQVEDDDATFDGRGTDRRLFLPQLPVTKIAEVVEDDEPLTVDEDYKLGAHGILWRIGAYWAEGIQNITVTYTHGYATIPDVIAAVCARVAARIYQAGLKAAQNGGISGVQAMTLGDYSVTYVSGADESVQGVSAVPPLLPGEMALLDRYAL